MTVRFSKTEMLRASAGSDLSFEISFEKSKPHIINQSSNQLLYSIMQSLVGFSVIPKDVTFYDL